MTLRGRMALGLVVVVGLAFWFLLDWLVRDLKPSHRRTTEEPLVDTARVLAALAAGAATNGKLDPALLARALEQVDGERFSAQIYGFEKTRVDLVVYVTDERGTVLWHSRGRDVGKDYSTKNDVYRTLRGIYGARTTDEQPDSVMYVAAPVTVAGKLAGVLSVGKPTTNVNRAVATARDRILSVGTGAGALIVLLGWVVAGMVARPVGQLTEYARAVRDGRKAPPPAGGPSEVVELTRAFEEMREALEGKNYVESYVQALTHEMKSPLSVLRGAAELMDEEMPAERRARFLDNIRGETARLTDLVEKMLLLASVEKRDRPRDLEPLDAAALAGDVKASLAPVLEARGITLEVLAGPPVAFPGERFLVRQAVANLVQNAVEFTPRGGRVRVHAGAAGDAVQIAVEDSGPGIPDWALPRVFERFFSLERPDTRRKSSGLGLAFVREVAQLHGGTIALGRSELGGARAALTFPAAPRA